MLNPSSSIQFTITMCELKDSSILYLENIGVCGNLSVTIIRWNKEPDVVGVCDVMMIDGLPW